MGKGSSSKDKDRSSSDSYTAPSVSAPRAADPVRVASVTPSYTPPTMSSVPKVVSSTPSTSRLPSAFDVTPQSLIDSRRDYEPGVESSSPGRVVAEEPATDSAPATPAPDPVKKVKLNNSTLRVAPTRATSPSQSGRTKSSTRTTEKSSPETAREPLRCKPRPTDNRPKGGGSGSFRRFIPWCG